MRINIDGVSLLEAKASVAGNYNYYMDITEYASKLFGTGIVERALLEVVSVHYQGCRGECRGRTTTNS